MFAYCLNNPVILYDSNGHLPSPANKTIFAVSLGQEYTTKIPSCLHIPDAKPIESAEDFLEAVEDLAVEIWENDTTQDVVGANRIKSGWDKIKKGSALIIVSTDPTFSDEFIGGGLIAWGFGQIITGLGELFDWTEDEE